MQWIEGWIAKLKRQWNPRILNSTGCGTRHKLLCEQWRNNITLNPPRNRESPSSQGQSPKWQKWFFSPGSSYPVKGRECCINQSCSQQEAPTFSSFLCSYPSTWLILPHLWSLVTLTCSWERRSKSCHCPRNKEGTTTSFINEKWV